MEALKSVSAYLSLEMEVEHHSISIPMLALSPACRGLCRSNKLSYNILIKIVGFKVFLFIQLH